MRPYFVSHTIVMRTNQPLKTILGKIEASGRMLKWAVELGQFEIFYEPRTAIKGQALADFVKEGTRDFESKPRTIYVDG